MSAFFKGLWQRCFLSKETDEVTVTRDGQSILALLSDFVYEYRGNNTFVIQEKTALVCGDYILK